MNLSDKSLKHIWYPCANMKDYQLFKPQAIHSAYGSYIELKDGRKIIDGISSWWCKSLGHNHPRLRQALIAQLDKFEHVMQPHMMHENIADLSERLAGLTKGLSKVFYASDGSTAVEIALKMSVHAHKNQGKHKKTKFIGLANGYHGETIATLGVSDLGRFSAPYRDLFFQAEFIQNLPYLNNIQSPLWHDCAESWQKIESFLEPKAEELAAIIFEPIVQGAGGMKIYSQDLLRRLRTWSKKHDVYLIADEIMTGIGRTGKMLACEHANIKPDFICLSKGLTSGMLPLSVTLTSQEIYDVFYNSEPFLHSNTHYGNALAVSVALETLKIFAQEDICTKVTKLNMIPMMQKIADQTGLINNVRGIGGIVAADLVNLDGFDFYQQAMQQGAILRPLGNVIYWLPPLNISQEDLEHLRLITQDSLIEAYKNKVRLN
jgi:adenosylmethionine-8-amino-7-oxononanoate aminotransferase